MTGGIEQGFGGPARRAVWKWPEISLTGPWAARIGLLVALVALADVVLWHVIGGLGVVVFAGAIFGAGALCSFREATPRAVELAGLVAIAAVLPMIEQQQFLSWVFLVLGGLVSGAILALGRVTSGAQMMRAARRLPMIGMIATVMGVIAAGKVARPEAMPRGRALSMLRDWVLPLGLGAVFIGLLVQANPLIEGWLVGLAAWNPRLEFDGDRIVFWIGMSGVLFPVVVLSRMRAELERPARPLKWYLPSIGLIQARSVRNALVMFNVIFAVQTLLDMAILWGNVALPEGMSYAEYAHRGAYPLVATALLAGVFALISQRFLAGRGMKVLLLLWVAQNVALVASSILRLELYVEIYGLTYLRFSAFVWMGLVGIGLLLMILQILRGWSMGWLISCNLGLSVAVFYVICFVNVAGVIAETNLARAKTAQVDAYYLCQLGDGALPAMLRHGAVGCGNRIAEPKDWRDWGFRNWRIRQYRDLALGGA